MKYISLHIKDVPFLCRIAWKVLWEHRLETRRTEGDWRGRTYSVTATDMEEGVRQLAVECHKQGKSVETFTYEQWCSSVVYGYRFSVEERGGLNNAIRSWLLDQVSEGVIAGHNFGRGHISGMRFRPAGEPIGPAEEGTLEKKAKERERDYKTNPLPVHASIEQYGGRAICQYTPGWHSWRRHSSRATNEKAKITCQACLNLIASPLAPKEKLKLDAFWNTSKKNTMKPEDRPLFKRLAKRANAEKFGKAKPKKEEEDA